MSESLRRNVITLEVPLKEQRSELPWPEPELEEMATQGTVSYDKDTGVVCFNHVLEDVKVAWGDTMLPLFDPKEMLDEDPDVDLFVEREVDRVIGWFKKEQPNEAVFYEECVRQLNTPNKPMSPVVVAIPVAAEESPDVLKHTLSQYAKQQFSKEHLELYLLINGHVPGDEESALKKIETLQTAVAEVRAQYPGLQIADFSTVYGKEPPTIGDVRRVLWNTIIFDAYRRGVAMNDVLVISNDADAIHISDNYVAELWATSVLTKTDMVAAKLVWETPGKAASYVGKLLRYWTYLDSIRDHNAFMPHTSDANTAVSLAAYAASGGFNGDAVLGEMNDLRERVIINRTGASRKPIAFTPHARLKTSSRRAIETMALGHAPWEAWNAAIMEFSHEDGVRTQVPALELAEQQTCKKWQDWLPAWHEYYIDRNVDDPEKRARLIRDGLRLVGLNN